MARFLLAVCAVAACAVVAYGGQLADIGRLSLLGPATTLSDPNPGAGAMTIEDDWGLAFNVLSQLNPDSPHLAGVDATDPAAVKVRVAARGGWGLCGWLCGDATRACASGAGGRDA